MAVLRGNLAPRGAIIKQSAATPALMQHTGRAVVFDSVEDMTERIDRPDLDVTRRRRPRAAQRRPDRRARHARGGLPADPAEARARKA